MSAEVLGWFAALALARQVDDAATARRAVRELRRLGWTAYRVGSTLFISATWPPSGPIALASEGPR